MSAKLNLANTETEYFKVLSEAPSKDRRTRWYCICKRCGKECIKTTDQLRGKQTKSCGCLKRDLTIERNKNNYKDITGEKFGSLTVLRYKGSLREHSAWECQCDCGNIIVTDSGSLRAGYRTSCGCKKQSQPVLDIKKILEENQIIFKQEVSFPDLKSKRNHALYFDFVIYNLDGSIKKIIEYDGEQHFSSKGDNDYFSDTLERRIENDNIKNNWCKNKNIELIRINYTQKKNINLKLLQLEGEKNE